VKTFTVFLILMFVAAAPAFSQDSGSEAAVNAESTTIDEANLSITSTDSAEADVAERLGVFTAWDFIRMILVLGGVIGVIYLVFILLKRSGSPKIRENRLIRVLSSKAISSGKAVHLLEVGNQVFLVGAAESSLSLLSEIVDKETLDGIRLQAASSIETEKRSFGDIMSQMFGKERSLEGDPAKPANPVGFLQQQRRRLKQI
jgi:flagellar protein FliO/FliZ